jgi:hypothetical protein
MPPVVFEPTVSAGERPQTYALDRAANGSGTVGVSGPINIKMKLANYLTWPYTIDRNSSPYYFSIQPNRFTHPDNSTFLQTSEYLSTTGTQKNTTIRSATAMNP